MALIVSRAILFLILALAFGIATVFPEQKLPLYIVFTLFVAVAIIMNVWFLPIKTLKSISLSLTNTSHTFYPLSQGYFTLDL